MEFTFKDREREIRELTKGVCLNYVAFWTKTDLKKSWNLFSITKGSGTGKTRLAISTLQLVRNELEKNRQGYLTLISKNLKKPTNTEEVGTKIFDSLVGSIRIDDLPSTLYIDLSNGDYIQDWTMAKSMEEVFLFYLACKTFFPCTKVNIIRAKIKEEGFPKQFTLETVATAIRQHHRLGPEETLTIVCNLDEYQTKLSDQDIDILLNKKDQKRQIFVRRMAEAVMSVCTSLTNLKEGIHLIPIFSGTLSMAYLGIFPATHYPLVSISVGPITSESSLKIVNASLKGEVQENVQQSLVESMGDIPRALEYLVSVIRAKNHQGNPKTMFNQTVNLISSKYGISSSPLTTKELKILMQLCLTGKEVSNFQMIDGKPLGSLVEMGVVFQKPSPTNQNLFQIQIPLVFLVAFNRVLQLFSSQFVTYRPIVKFQEMEQFGMDFEEFENNPLWISE